MDVLQLVQHGIPYAVAVLGTALTERQLLSLRPFGGDELRVFFFFDGDQAGRKAPSGACVEAFKACVDAGFWGRAAFLPEGADPDSYVQEHGTNETLALLEHAPALEDVYFDCVAPAAGASLQDRARAIEEVRQAIASAKSDVQRQLLAQRAEIRLGLKEEILRAAPAVRPAMTAPPRRLRRLGKRPTAELMLVEAMAASREVSRWVDERGTLSLCRDGELVEVGTPFRGGLGAAGRDRPCGRSTAGGVGRPRDGCAGRAPAPAGEGDPMQIATDCDARIRLQAQRDAQRAGIEALRKAEHAGDDGEWRDSLTTAKALLRREGGAP